MRICQRDHALSPDTCVLCRKYTTDPDFRALMNSPEVAAAVGGRKTLRAGKCRHLGEQAGEVQCGKCGNGVRLKMYACAVHGKCTLGKKLDGVMCCATCPQWEPPDRPVGRALNMGTFGLGDSLLGLCAVLGYVDRHGPTAYAAPPAVHPMLSLFKDCPQLTNHTLDKNVRPGTGLQLNAGYATELSSKCEGGRLARYCRNVGGVVPRLPTLRDEPKLRERWSQWQGCVVLAPCVSSPDWRVREWPRMSWVSLYGLLRDRGPHVVLLDDTKDRLAPFPKDAERLLSLKAEDMVGLMLNASCVVSNDSGPAHVAGIVGTATLIFSGVTEASKVCGFYPRVQEIRGPLSCNGCWWQYPHRQDLCGGGCPSIAAVPPFEVARLVEQVVESEHARRSRHKLVSNHSVGWDEMASLTWPTKQRWARLHGWECEDLRQGTQFDWRARLRWWRDQLSQLRDGAWLWALGCDAAITGDQTAPISKGHDLVIAADGNGLNADSVLMRKTEGMLRLLDEASKHHGREWMDQEALECLLSDRQSKRDLWGSIPDQPRCGGHPLHPRAITRLNTYFQDNQFGVRAAVVPQRAMNAYPSGEYGFAGQEDWAWHEGDLVLHVPGLTYSQRLSALRSRLKACSSTTPAPA